MALTLKKRLFAEALDKGLSNTEAAIEAGYNENTAPQAGSRLAKDEDVIRYREDSQDKVERLQVNTQDVDPIDVLKQLCNDPDPKVALDAAKALMPYMHPRIAPSGKKEGQKENAAKKTQTGKFATLSQQTKTESKLIQ